ncbi:hypothetical protein N8Z24_00170 [bacterium]|nr:hypothetical protein [bacterium]
MSSWNYRIVKKVEDGKWAHYSIHEVHYDDNGKPEMVSVDPIPFEEIEHINEITDDEAVQNIIKSMERALKTLKKYPVFVPPEEWSE